MSNGAYKINRRHFLGALGAGAMAASTSSAFLFGTARANQSHHQHLRRFVIREDRFGRIFPNLPPFFEEVTPQLLDALREVGAPGGMLDAGDDLAAGPVALIANPALSAN